MSEAGTMLRALNLAVVAQDTGVVPGGDDAIIFALIALIGTSIGALVYTIKNNGIIKEAARDASEANRAVNHTEYGEHRLYDLVKQVQDRQEHFAEKWDQFDRRWGNLPAEYDDAVGLSEVIGDIHRRLEALQLQLIELAAQIAAIHREH